MLLSLLFLLPLLGAAEPTPAPPPSLRHDPVDCIVAGKFAVIPACFEPAQLMARGRVYNLVEARLLEGGSGLWQFGVAGRGPAEARTLRVVAGELAAIGPGTVTFRLSGRPGERVAFVWTWTGRGGAQDQ